MISFFSLFTRSWSWKSLIRQAIVLYQSDLFFRRLGFGISFSALISGAATYWSLRGDGLLLKNSSHVLPWIYLDLALLLLLSMIIARRLVELWLARRQGSAGSRLHLQISAFFTFVALTPSFLVMIFSALFFYTGVQGWFSEPVRQALGEAREVAQAYLHQNSKTIVRDALDIAMILKPQMAVLSRMPDLLADQLTELTTQRGIAEAIIFNEGREVIARSYLTFALEFEKVSTGIQEQAQRGEVIIIPNADATRVRAIIHLDPETQTYLYLGKFVEPSVLRHITQTQEAVNAYNQLERERSTLEMTFVLFFSVVALLLLLAAIWVGLALANFLVSPISRLIQAADQVSQGHLDVQITAEGSTQNELGNLIEAFNKMTRQLAHQRQGLIQANHHIDQRRALMETILESISAGVIRIDPDMQILLMNRRARELLGVPLTPSLDPLFLSDVAKELIPFVHASFHSLLHSSIPQVHQVLVVRGSRSALLQVTLVDNFIPDGTLEIKTHPESALSSRGCLITFDDVAPLVSAQRQAAWSDVAQKIAHEIKNPLTPIQLAAERLKRRYLKEISTSPEIFHACIETIVRQVRQIGRLVGEFSSFARMPDPEMRTYDLVELARQSISLQHQAHPHIHFVFQSAQDMLSLDCDSGQIGQVLTNLLQNAINALEEFPSLRRPDPPSIRVWVGQKENKYLLVIEDNGPGFPVEGRERLIEPYYTTREKGTGLGLAIVSKIIEDHHGRLELGDSATGGAKVMIEFLVGK